MLSINKTQNLFLLNKTSIFFFFIIYWFITFLYISFLSLEDAFNQSKHTFINEIYIDQNNKLDNISITINQNLVISSFSNSNSSEQNNAILTFSGNISGFKIKNNS